MSEVFERIREEGRLEGRLEGKIEGKQEGRKESLMEVIKCMLSNQFSLEDIALSTGLSIDDIKSFI